ncbi:MAG: heparinase II/III family protein [Armatimonadota bacterium]
MISAKVCRWYGGRKAALSLRFDDSGRTHIEKAVPLLNERGLIGTFLVNPGRPSFEHYRSVWEGPVVEQGHELGDHTWDHRGATTDEDAEQQIGGCADYLRRIQPKPELKVFVGGGRTIWTQRKPIEYFLAKYHLIRSGGDSMSCSEDYPSFTFDAFRRRVDEGIGNGEKIQFHFHPIQPEPGNLHISEPLFRQCLDYVRARRDDVWQAGMSAIRQYEVERDSTLLQAYAVGDDALGLRFACGADPEWYTQPLTLQVSLPPRVRIVEVLDAKGSAIAARVESDGATRVARFEVKPVDAVYTVRAKGIGAAYLRDSGPDLAPPGPHPYLFFDRHDLPALRQKAAAGVPKGIWEDIKARADDLAQRPQEQGESLWDQRRRLRLLSFAYAMTDDRRYLDPALKAVEALAASEEWWTPNSEMLITAETICTLALAYDWMHDDIPAGLRGSIRAAIVDHGIRPILTDVAEREWYTNWYRCNWGSVVFGQAGVASLALLADEPEAADWARLFIEKIWHFPQALDRNGGWGESGTYAGYLWFRTLLLADAAQRVTGGRIDLFSSTEKLRLLPGWFEQLMEPDRRSYIPFADCGRGTESVVPILYRLARAYGDGHAQWFAEDVSQGERARDVFSFLWCDPSVKPVGPSDLPTAVLFPDISWAILRSRWDDPRAILFGLKGGQQDWDHQHHDANHFVLYAYGRPLIVDLLYPEKVWGLEAEAHNSIMVNDKDQRGRLKLMGGHFNPEHRGVVADLHSARWYARVVGDASLAYDQDDVKSSVREVMYLRHASDEAPPDYFVMLDDVSCSAPSKVDWLLHTYGNLRISGNRVTVAQDDAAADVTFVTPERLEHELHEKTLEEAGSASPFEGADTVRYAKLHAPSPVQRAHFLAVIAPRPAALASQANLSVSPLNGPNTAGAHITHGSVKDIALFALDEPKMSGGGVSAAGRSCFVRRSNGKVTAASLHGGENLSLDGVLLFDSDSCGTAVIAWQPDGIEAYLDIYNCLYARIHSERKPTRVVANGRDQEFEFDPQAQCIKIVGELRRSQVSISY